MPTIEFHTPKPTRRELLITWWERHTLNEKIVLAMFGSSILTALFMTPLFLLVSRMVMI